MNLPPKQKIPAAVAFTTTRAPKTDKAILQPLLCRLSLLSSRDIAKAHNSNTYERDDGIALNTFRLSLRLVASFWSEVVVFSIFATSRNVSPLLLPLFMKIITTLGFSIYSCIFEFIQGDGDKDWNQIMTMSCSTHVLRSTAYDPLP